jgi:hypothetical protein
MNRKPGTAGEYVGKLLYENHRKAKVVDPGAAVLLGYCVAQVSSGTGGFPNCAADDSRPLPVVVIRSYLCSDELADGTSVKLMVIVEDGPAHHESPFNRSALTLESQSRRR